MEITRTEPFLIYFKGLRARTRRVEMCIPTERLDFEGLLEFSQAKAVADTRVALRRELFWFPYRPQQLALLKRLTRTVFGTRG